MGFHDLTIKIMVYHLGFMVFTQAARVRLPVWELAIFCAASDMVGCFILRLSEDS